MQDGCLKVVISLMVIGVALFLRCCCKIDACYCDDCLGCASHSLSSAWMFCLCTRMMSKLAAAAGNVSLCMLLS